MKEILTFVVLLILGALRYFEYRHSRMINPIYHEQTNHHRGWVRNTLGSEEPVLLPVLLRGVGLRLS